MDTIAKYKLVDAFGLHGRTSSSPRFKNIFVIATRIAVELTVVTKTTKVMMLMLNAASVRTLTKSFVRPLIWFPWKIFRANRSVINPPVTIAPGSAQDPYFVSRGQSFNE
eukprot:673746_1